MERREDVLNNSRPYFRAPQAGFEQVFARFDEGLAIGIKDPPQAVSLEVFNLAPVHGRLRALGTSLLPPERREVIHEQALYEVFGLGSAGEVLAKPLEVGRVFAELAHGVREFAGAQAVLRGV